MEDLSYVAYLMGFLFFVLHVVLPFLSAQTDSFFVQAKAQEKKHVEINQQQSTDNLQPTISYLPPTPTIPLPTKTPMPIVLSTTQNQQSDALRSAINTFRNTHGISPLSWHATLCTVAKNRWNEIYKQNALDSHAGFIIHTDTLKKQFQSWGEVLHFSSPPWNATNIVNNGWATSSKGHREAMLTLSYTHGCGATGSGFAVFIFGQKK